MKVPKHVICFHHRLYLMLQLQWKTQGRGWEGGKRSQNGHAHPSAIFAFIVMADHTIEKGGGSQFYIQLIYL